MSDNPHDLPAAGNDCAAEGDDEAVDVHRTCPRCGAVCQEVDLEVMCPTHGRLAEWDVRIRGEVAIGRLIEEQERPKARALRAERIGETMRRRAAGEDVGDSPRSYGSVTDRVASAVGMDRQAYTRAKKVVEAAEADPKAFGDLPAVMDETGNVSGTRRRARKAARRRRLRG